MSRGHEADVVVIGGGLAGLTACLAAEGAGARTLLLHKGERATALSSGLVDLLGYREMNGNTRMVTSPLEGIWALAHDQDDHPYALLGGGNAAAPKERADTARDIVSSAIGFFRAALEAAGLRYVGDGHQNLLIATPFGTFKPTGLAPDSVAKGNLVELSGAHLLVAGIRGYAAFNPVLVAHSLAYVTAQALGGNREYLRATGHWLGLGDRAWALPQLASYLDTEAGYQALEMALVTARLDTSYTHLALPCAGQERAAENLERLETRLQATVFEIPGLPPCPGGQRLVRALEREAATRGVRILPGQEVVAADLDGDRCRSVRARSILAGYETTFHGQAFVLCTGDVIGGGLSSTQLAIREPVFDLALSAPSGTDLEQRTTWIGDEPFPQEGHPVAAIGVATADGLRGVSRSHDTVENLFVAGAILAGARWSIEKDGLGIALSTGFLAGRNAAQCAIGPADRAASDRSTPEHAAPPAGTVTAGTPGSQGAQRPNGQ